MGAVVQCRKLCSIGEHSIFVIDQKIKLTVATVVEQKNFGFANDTVHNRFSDEDIWDIGAIAAFFAQSNRLANLSNMRPNDEFYSMGR